MKNNTELDYSTLGFTYVKTPYNLRCHYKNGAWGEVTVSEDENISIHIASTALHYGQQAFEGLKAVMGADGKARIFRVADNAKRMQNSAKYLEMAVPPIELFCDMVERAVKLNVDFVPPYGSGGTLYIRPVLFGVGATVGVKPSEEFLLVVFVTPVGRYFKNDSVGINTLVDREHDRSGSKGTGHVKAGGNYASAMQSTKIAHEKGYNSAIYLDPIEHRYIDECGTTNFFGIKNNTYVTPISGSILPSITNMTLQQLAQDMGMKVEQRKIDFLEEITTFDEVGGCGTAAVVAPISSIFDPESNRTYTFDTPGEITSKLRDQYKAIQCGDAEDTHGWNTVL